MIKYIKDFIRKRKLQKLVTNTYAPGERPIPILTQENIVEVYEWVIKDLKEAKISYNSYIPVSERNVQRTIELFGQEYFDTNCYIVSNI